MDNHISSWILEFLLRQQTEDWIPCNFISLLPPLNSNLRLKKTILLRRISSLLSNKSISESILKSLEMIEEIDHRSGIPTSNSMRMAYSSVAVECAAKFLREEPEDYGAFSDAVNRIWKGKIGFMRRWEGGVGLVSGGLRDMEKEMLAAVEKPSVRRILRERDTKKEAVDSVTGFLKEMREEMGPSFLEFAAEAMFGEGRVGRNSGAERDCFEGMDMRKGSLRPSEKDVFIGDVVSTKNPMLATSEKVGNDRMENEYDILPSPEVAKAQEALKSSSLHLQTVVQDPLPVALEIAAEIVCKNEQINQKGLENNQNMLDVDAHNSSVEKGIDDSCVREISTVNKSSRDRNGTSRSGFMAWNRTAHTYEWDDDSIESPSDESPNGLRELYLPSPKKKVISPLNKQEITRCSKRRKTRKWTPEEEEALRTAVQESGIGHWKYILNCNPKEFVGRTEVDLKDKWRNMVRY